MNENTPEIFERMLAGGLFRLDDPAWQPVAEAVNRTIGLSAALNTSTDTDQIRERLSEIIGSRIDQ
ncbi:MAG TPA: hypothetical protein VHC47_11950, partial [Mucilaginibacter sp.]|nr:hypothetical protein [Mucilaginibacter sp.]